MKIMTPGICLWVLLLSIPHLLSAQEILEKGNNKIHYFEDKGIPLQSNPTVLKDLLNLSKNFEFKVKTKNKSRKATRYQLEYKGYKVKFQHILTYESGNYLDRLVTSDLSQLNFEEKPLKISQEEAIQILAEKYRNKKPITNHGSMGPLVETVYFPTSQQEGTVHRLSHEIYLMLEEKPFQYLAYVDAFDGKILEIAGAIYNYSPPAINCNIPDAEGIADLAYNDVDQIITTGVITVNSDYILHDCTRGSGLHTQKIGFSIGNGVDYHDDNNQWLEYGQTQSQDQYALDAHYGSAVSFDLSMNKMGVDITDGAPFYTYLSTSGAWANNAAYISNRNAVVFGAVNGPGGTGGFLTAMDIVGHEIGHAITALGPELTFENEAGSLNEALSDIFGMMVQSAGGDLNWILGEQVFPVRSMENPNAFGHPDTYMGQNWYTGSNQQELIHTNNGVINHMFYLLTVGGSGVNDLGETYSVTGLGLELSGALIMDVWQNGLTPNSTFHDFAQALVLAAIDIYSECSDEHESVVNALHAVGLGIPFNADQPIVNLVADPVTNCSANLEWKDNGAFSYTLFFRVVGTGTWSTVDKIMNNRYILSDLDPNTNYEWYVTNACEVNNGSYLIDNFTTEDNCPIVDMVNITEVSYCHARLEWENLGVQQYELFYRIDGSTDPYLSEVVTDNFVILIGLQTGATYEGYIETTCGAACPGGSSPLFKFSLDNCETNNTASIVNISSCRATLEWELIPGQSYEVRVGWFGLNNLESEVIPAGQNFYSYDPPGTPSDIIFELVAICEGLGCIVENVSDPIIGMFTEPNPDNSCDAPINAIAELTMVGNEYFWTVDFTPVGDYDIHQVRWRSTTTGNFSQPIDVPLNSISMTMGLNSCVELEIRTNCNCDAPGLTSGWIPLGTYCIPCDPPTEITVSDICTESAYVELGAHGGLDDMEARYRAVDAPDWNGNFTVRRFIPNFELEDLMPGTLYEVEARSRCGTFPDYEYSDYIHTEFRTVDLCLAPSGLSANATDAYTANIQWNPATGASYYDVEFRPAGSNTYSSGTITSNTFTLSNVDLLLGYFVRVRSICSHCDISDWSDEIFVQYSAECIPGLYISQSTSGDICDPCEKECYVCIYDDNGTPIMQTGNWYVVEWPVLPSNYPYTSQQLLHNQCIPMAPAYSGGTFVANVHHYGHVNGNATLLCTQEVSYTHDCGQPDPESGGEGGSEKKYTGSQFQPIAFPNPTKGRLTIIKPDDQPVTLQLINIDGRLIMESLLLDSKINLDLSHLPSALYFLKFLDDRGRIIKTQKLTKF